MKKYIIIILCSIISIISSLTYSENVFLTDSKNESVKNSV